MGLLNYFIKRAIKKEHDWEKIAYGDKIKQDLKIRQHNAYLEKDYPEYEKCTELFNYCIKNHKFNHELLYDFKNMVDEHLGTFQNRYNNYKFKNDVHEIYVKLKDEGLMRFDFQELNEFLTTLKGNEKIKSDTTISCPEYKDEKIEHNASLNFPEQKEEKVVNIEKYK
jgi:hypothetical protein